VAVSAPPGGACEASASFVSRAIALVIDVVLLAVVIAASEWTLRGLEEVLRPWRRFDVSIAVTAAAPAIIILYFVVCWSFGQTAGKWILGLRVIASGGGKVGPGRALLRLLGYLVSAAPLYLGFLWVLVDRDHRGFHDLIADTRVVYSGRDRPPG
jgi:uncharacterized RDD family membrane protein YckC